MSSSTKLVSAFNKYFEENETFARKDLLEFAKKAYDENYKKTKKNDENAIKKPLNEYQLFMKEQRIILNKRESEKEEGEKKKSTELMKEIAEMWKIHKEGKKKEGEVEKDEKKEDEVKNDEKKEDKVKKDEKKEDEVKKDKKKEGKKKEDDESKKKSNWKNL
jgi:hypothetical protein